MYGKKDSVFKRAYAIKDYTYKESGVRINTGASFFQPFNSLADVRKQLRSPVVAPIVDLTLAVQSCLHACRNVLETAINIVFLDVGNIEKSVPEFFTNVFQAAYFAGSALTDTLWDLTALATRTLSTVVDVAAAIAGGIAEVGYTIVKECTPRSVSL
ncbi:hypothetical protein [Legionella feeleii]|uniref:Uncharacterized protein n=1 Tax=Legionella feeleii TaxID=453 RepID=A0A378IV32_9GAMM|nr:hypothetical protein [Legionella feeleii]STX38762.1 Uncharacterised protein [Legionella feeleii]